MKQLKRRKKKGSEPRGICPELIRYGSSKLFEMLSERCLTEKDTHKNGDNRIFLPCIRKVRKRILKFTEESLSYRRWADCIPEYVIEMYVRDKKHEEQARFRAE